MFLHIGINLVFAGDAQTNLHGHGIHSARWNERNGIADLQPCAAGLRFELTGIQGKR
jgi:hypothetical protein